MAPRYLTEPAPWEGRFLKDLARGPDIPWQRDILWAEQTVADYEVGLLEPDLGAPVLDLYEGRSINLTMGWTLDY